MKYLKNFNTLLEYEDALILDIPNTSYIVEDEVVKYSELPKVGSKYILYKSSDGNVVTPYSTGVFGASLISNNYDDFGLISFDAAVTSIGFLAFYDRSSLTSITIPNSVTSIGSYAFQDCFSLKSIVIPDSVTSIGSDPFLNCSSLTSPVYNAHCFVYMPASYSDTYIIPEGIEQIVAAAFYDCSSLTSVTIPNSVTNIGDNAFNNCSSLTSITIPNSVISIGNSVFDNCSSLTSVTIGESVTRIGSSAFLVCPLLTTITCEATTPPTLGSYNNLSTVTAVYVPSESVDLYKNATNWSYYSNVIQPIQ